MKTNLFQRVNIVLHSGEKSDFKIECDALTNEDIETLAYLVNKQISFRNVVGVPKGGIRLANSLMQYRTPETNTLLIVDDVFTTGRSMEEEKSKYGIVPIHGVVIFARNKCPDWVTPIFRM